MIKETTDVYNDKVKNKMTDGRHYEICTIGLNFSGFQDFVVDVVDGCLAINCDFSVFF